ncbi:MAG: ACT domain-containing protein [Bacteroidetes bacterium]|nr:ACT domain-containing protein [Bacteroidota bacterium]
MNNSELSLSIMPNKIAVCRMENDAQIPFWATDGSFFSISKTDDEISIVCSENNVPDNVESEKGWRSFKVEGPLDFSLTGILASLANPLAEAKISIFAISTFDTDYILMKDENLDEAVKVLSTFCNIQR